MSGAPAPSLLLATGPPESVLVAVIVILAVLVVIAGAAVVVLLRRGSSRESLTSAAARLESKAAPPPVPPPPPGGPGPGQSPAGAPDATAPSTSTPAPPAVPAGPPAAPTEAGATVSMSPTQTPDDVDRRSPAELAAAARAAEDVKDQQTGAGDGGAPLETAIQHPVAIGPPRPVPIAETTHPDPARLRMLGLTLGMLTERVRREHPPQLGTALARLVDSDQEAARSQLSALALSLLGEDEEPSVGDSQLSLFLEEALAGEVRRGFSFSTMPEFQQALHAIAPELREKLQTIVWARNADSVALLTTEDVETLERVAVAMATALMLDTAYDMRRFTGNAPAGGA